MNKSIQVIINEQHTLLSQQEELLNQKFGKNNWDFFKVPSQGWTSKEIKEISKKLNTVTCVFCSPIPYLMKLIFPRMFFVFHNSNREKLELPNGKIIFKVSQTGWELL